MASCMLADALILTIELTVRCITGGVKKITLLVAGRAFIRRRILVKGVATIFTFPGRHGFISLS